MGSLVSVLKYIVCDSGPEIVVPLDEESKESDESVLNRAESVIRQLKVSIKRRTPFVI